jgi:hypothetical protein
MILENIQPTRKNCMIPFIQDVQMSRTGNSIKKENPNSLIRWEVKQNEE